MPSFISRLFTSFSQFVKLDEKNAHDNSDSYSPVLNPDNSNAPVTSYFSRIISILRHAPSPLMQTSSSSNPPPETNQYDHVSIPVGDQTPATTTPPPDETTAVELMDVINELSTILTSQHDISKLKWAHPKFMNQKHCGSFLDNTSVALLLLHYGIWRTEDGVYVNVKNGDVETLQQAINHMLLLAITTDDNEINLPEVTPFYKSGTSPKIISSAKSIYQCLKIFTSTLVDEMIKMVPEEDLGSEEIPMLARAATICYILTKQKSTTTIKKLLEIDPCIYSHFTLVTMLVVKMDMEDSDLIYDTLPDIFSNIVIGPRMLITILESITGLSIVPRNAHQCMYYSDAKYLQCLSFHERISLTHFTSPSSSLSGMSDISDVFGYWTIDPYDNDRLYFRSLRCDASKPCPLRCNDVFDYKKLKDAEASKDIGDTTYIQTPQEQQEQQEQHEQQEHLEEQQILTHPSCTTLMVPEKYAHRLLRRGKFELRFDWRILAIFSCMAAILIGLVVGQNIISQFTLSIDIRPVLIVLIAVFTGLASALNNWYWPDTTFSDFVSCRRAIVDFSDAASTKYACVGCQTAALLESRDEVSRSAAGSHVNLIGQPSSTSKENGILIDRPGTTSCLHRTGFYFIESFSPTVGEMYVIQDVVEKNVRAFTIKPCEALLDSTHNIRDKIYSAKFGKAFFVQEVSKGRYVAVIAVVDIGLREYGRLTWLEKPVIVEARSSPRTPVQVIG
ncbi:hypothetical protein GQ42DRAFT_164677 [Ramicandelaber brevisporus]|nr:hypothetical protein GQ42DRAFT_164677 [Ramicandelaber brevisporus]